ncbi:AAA family ATPase [Ruegeria sp. R13_0]|uniref:AAA and adenylate/guanylate cyclase domain-containing protein n=1 Tax=Ruegeria sp. R13_0 TaxID=2821099 RepID=UPI001ADD2E2E|nr:AAA and adenylate/guanylate cyclase domain-containing protein [Ruegeria sp. R13_0]MBO9433772.1 AAA family ATPase [Ruegeria sp. R13_0]
MGEGNSILASFLPLRLLGSMYPRHRARPSVVRLSGAALFVDVSRYTALVEQLARRGQTGLEEIPKLLDQTYSRSANQIMANGGEVLSFSGDSFLAYWPADTLGAAEAVRRAISCAGAICRKSERGADLSVVSDTPAIHAGIGFGEMWVATVGGNPVWNLIFGGTAILQAATAQSHARSSSYALSDVAQAVLDTSADPVVKPAQADLSDCPPYSWLRGFLPQHFQDNLFPREEDRNQDSASGRNTLHSLKDVDAKLDELAEVRPISALFARIVGISTDSPPATEQFQALCVSLQALLIARDCPVGEMLIDDKGLVYWVAFGEPGKFHRDDPQRALDAACAIRATVLAHGFDTSIGIATGEALFRVVGSPRCRQWMVIGQTVNRAARLMTETDGAILCDAPTERVARSEFLFKRRGTLQLLGLSDMTPVFEPLERTPSTVSSVDIVGRTKEIEALKSAFENVKSGANHIVIVDGEAGIGKTTLVKAFADDLKAEGYAVSIACADREVQRTSLLIWRRVLEFLVGVPIDSNGNQVLELIRVRTQNQQDIEKRLPLLGDVLSIDIPQTEMTRHLQGAHRADATMRLLGTIIDRLGPRPLTLVLEDCQWLDSASWRSVEWVFGSVDSLFLVLCVRAGEAPEELEDLRRRTNLIGWQSDGPAVASHRACETLKLMALDERSIQQLVARTLGDAPPSDELAENVSRLAGGNPFFAEEISLSLRNQGLITLRDGFWCSSRPLDELTFFEGVEKVIRERVDRLDMAVQKVLKSAAVIGRRFNISALRFLNGAGAKKIVLQLADAQLITDTDEPDVYEFRHGQIRDVVYNSIPSEIRRQLHGAIARWIETTRPQATGADLAILVQHFEAADDFDHAVKYADLAATNAVQVGAFREVESFVGICLDHERRQRALEPLEKLRSVRWRRQLAEAHYSRGDIRAQGVAIRKALDVAGQPVPTNSGRILMLLIMRFLLLYLRNLLPIIQKHLDRTDSKEREREISRCLGQAATVDYFELRMTRGMCNLAGSVLHAEKAGETVETAISSAQLASGLGMMRLRKANNRLMQRAEQVAVKLDDPSTQSHICTVDALWRLGLCEWHEVDTRVDQALQLAQKAGDQLRWCNAQGIRFWSQYYRGDLSSLEETALALLSRAQNAGHTQQEIWALRCKALCMLHIDRPREAVEILHLISSGTTKISDLAAEVSIKGAHALSLSRVGKHGASYDTSVEMMRLLEQIKRPSSHVIIVGIGSVLELLLRGREAGVADGYDEWKRLEDKAFGHLSRYCKTFIIGETQLGLWSGLDQWLNGHCDRAMQTWRSALKVAQDRTLRKDESLILAEIRRRE